MAPSISWGDLQEDRLGMKSGWKVSQYLIQPGEQEVIIGSTPPLVRRSISS